MGFKKSQSGFSLVEISVTMAVASAMSLAIMQVINQSQKSNKAVSSSSDWNILISSVQNSLNNEEVCNSMFAKSLDVVGDGSQYKATTAGGVHTFDGKTSAVTISKLEAVQPNGKGGFTPSREILGGAGTNFGTFKITKLQMIRTPAVAVPVTMIAPPLPGLASGLVGQPLSFTRYQMELEIEADRILPAGAKGVVALPKREILFTLVTGPNSNPADGKSVDATKNQIFSCFGSSSPAQVCAEMGGVYDGDANPHCKMSNLYLGTNKNTDPPSKSGNPGARIQLWGTHGDSDANDYAIGIDGSTMWFNAGSGTDKRFLFTNDGGKNALMEFENDSSKKETWTIKIPMPFGKPIIMTDTITIFIPGIQFYESLVIGKVGAERGLTVNGSASISKDLSIYGDAYVHGALHVGSDSDGNGMIWFTNGNDLTSAIYLDDFTDDLNVIASYGDLNLYSSDRVFLTAGPVGGEGKAVLDSGGEFSVKSINVETVTTDQINVTAISAKIKAIKGSNVAHDCYTKEVNGCGGNTCHVYCIAGDLAMSGGVRCSKSGSDDDLQESRHAYVSGQVLPAGWTGRCDDDTETKVSVLCCKM